MKRSSKYVALDVHQATTVASVREESGRVIARTVLPTEETALLEFFGGMRGSVHVSFEEGTQAQWLHDLLSPRVHRITVCDRRGEKKHGNTSDVVDADQFSEDLRRRRQPMRRGLNRNCNRRVKDIFKAAANAAAARPGPLQEFVSVRVERGMKEELARATLARKLAALTLRIWKRGEHYDPSKLSTQMT
jgi:hypothetical protein